MQIKSYHISKTDKRYSGSDIFKYVIQDITGEGFTLFPAPSALSNNRFDKIKTYVQFRNWCWETWGPSCERDYYLYMKHVGKDDININLMNPHWCWYSSGYDKRIYLAGDEEKVWFKLKWD